MRDTSLGVVPIVEARRQIAMTLLEETPHSNRGLTVFPPITQEKWMVWIIGLRCQMGLQAGVIRFHLLIGALPRISSIYHNDHALAMTFSSIAIEVGRAFTATVVLAGRVSAKYSE